MNKLGYTLMAEKTKLFAITRKKVCDFYETILNDKLWPWRFYDTHGVRVTRHNGQIISSKGKFGGTIKLVFWEGFIEPFLEDAIEEVLQQTAKTCRELKPDSGPYIRETVSLLRGFTESIYKEMVRIDWGLTGRGDPRGIIPESVQDKIVKMNRYTQEHAVAAKLMASPDTTSRDDSAPEDRIRRPGEAWEIEAMGRIGRRLVHWADRTPLGQSVMIKELSAYERDLVNSLWPLDDVLKWLRQHNPHEADWVDEKYVQLLSDIRAEIVGSEDHVKCPRPVERPWPHELTKGAVDLAKRLRRIAEMARSDLTPEKPTEAKHDITPAEEQEEKAKEIPSINIQDSNVILGDVQAKNLQIGDNACIDKQSVPKKPAGTGQKEIVEVKPGVFGITVNIKELASRFGKWVCSRSKD